VHALAAGQPHEALQADLQQAVAHIARTRLHVRPAHAFAGVQIEHQPVRMLGILDRRAPRVQLQRVHLHQLQQATRIIDVDVVLAAALLLQRHRMHGVAQAGAMVLLEEAGLADAIRAAQQ